jgi:hypothetical protein
MFDFNKSHDANKSAEDLKYYVRSIALLGEMKRAGCHHPSRIRLPQVLLHEGLQGDVRPHGRQEPELA